MLSTLNFHLKSQIYAKLGFGIVFKHYSQRKHTLFKLKWLRKQNRLECLNGEAQEAMSEGDVCILQNIEREKDF